MYKRISYICKIEILLIIYFIILALLALILVIALAFDWYHSSDNHRMTQSTHIDNIFFTPLVKGKLFILISLFGFAYTPFSIMQLFHLINNAGTQNAIKLKATANT